MAHFSEKLALSRQKHEELDRLGIPRVRNGIPLSMRQRQQLARVAQEEHDN